MADAETTSLFFRSHKAALLFARLALHPHRVHRRDELADWLWPDMPIEKGRANVSLTLHRLKCTFANDANGSEPSAALITSDQRGIRLRADAFETDAVLFEKRVSEVQQTRDLPPLERAARYKAVVECYSGDLMPGFFDDWIETERQRLRALFEIARTNERAAKAAPPVPSPQQKSVMAAAPQTVGFPLTLTRFFGRDAECADLCARLTQAAPFARLMTLTGAGGMGKTRLVLEASRQIGDTFAFAVFASLADVSDAALIPAVLAQLLLPKAQANASELDEPLPRVIDFLLRAGGEGGRVLLVLDNLEQFGAACAPVVADLLTRVPPLTVLSTSRQPVGVSGEQEIPIGPLLPGSAPSERADLPPDVALFMDRARLVRPAFALTPQNEMVARDLCCHLEGVPLAIELAAAWTRALSPVQITERLSRRFELLQRTGTGYGDLPKRHQSLHATIAWSYDLLPSNLQTFWAQLSLFRGGWTMEAARAVTGVDDVAKPLLLLTERSLILTDGVEATGAARYRMLESLREFASQRWDEQEITAKNGGRLRHAQYFARLSQEADTMTKEGRGMRPALALLGPERDNLRALFTDLLDMVKGKGACGDYSIFGPIVQAAVESMLQSIWLWSGSDTNRYLQGAMQAVDAVDAVDVLSRAVSGALRARILALQGRRASLSGDYPAGERLLNESLVLWQAVGDKKEAVLVKNALAAQAWQTGGSARAFAIYCESLRFAQETGDLRLESAMLHNLALIGPDLAQRRAWVERALALDRVHWPGSTFYACSISCLGYVAKEQKDWETAQACLEEAHTIAAADGARGMVAVTKQCLADFFIETNVSLERAEELLRDAQYLYEELEEWPRIASVLLSRFQAALKQNNGEAARHHARAYLCLNESAGLMTADALASAQVDMQKQLVKAEPMQVSGTQTDLP